MMKNVLIHQPNEIKHVVDAVAFILDLISITLNLQKFRTIQLIH